MRYIFSLLACLLVFVSQQSLACEAGLQPVSQEGEASKEYSDGEISRFKNIDLEEGIENKEEYCNVCRFLENKLTQTKEKGEEEDPLYKWGYVKCKGVCGLDKVKACGSSDNTDPKEKWEKHKKEKLLSDPEKLKAHCKKCDSMCDNPTEQQKSDPLHKWKCIQCKRECSGNMNNQENKNDKN